MDYRRRYKGDNNGGFEESRRRSMRKKPPRGANWQPTVPNWEKKFCKVVGSLDWETFLYKKRFVHLDDKVVKWNDSAGEEAFCNAKKRFLAQLNGWHCEIPLSSPDLYIDKVDWDAQVDQDLVLDLEDDESLVPVKPEEHHEPVVIFGDALIRNLGLSNAGWGDEDEKLEKDDNPNANLVPTGWDDNWLKMEDTVKNDVPQAWPVNNNWENNESSKLMDSGWDDDWLRMESNAKNNVSGVCQVSSNNWENKNSNSGRYITQHKSSRFMESNNYYQKGRYNKWRGGSNNGKREAIVN